MSNDTKTYRFRKDKPKDGGHLFIHPNVVKNIQYTTSGMKGKDYLDKSVRVYEALLLGFTDPELLMAFAEKKVKVEVVEDDTGYDINLEVVA